MNIKKLRLRNKKSQAEIAKLLGISQSNYGKYELGTIEPNLEILCKLANFYNVSLDYLVGRSFKNDLGFLTKEQYCSLSEFLKLPDSDQQKVMGYISALSKE